LDIDKVPNSKSQAPNNFKIRMFKSQNVLGFRFLKIVIYLGFIILYL